MSLAKKALQQKGRKEPMVFVLVDGTFQCQICHEDVNEAKHFPTERLLVWECSMGHKSFLEEFGIG